MRLTEHAVRRYNERVKPTLGLGACRRELEALLAGAEEVARPEWLHAHHPDTESYLELADGIVAGVQGGAVATVLIRAETSPVYRRAKNEQRRKRRAVRRHKNKAHAKFKADKRIPPERSAGWD